MSTKRKGKVKKCGARTTRDGVINPHVCGRPKDHAGKHRCCLDEDKEIPCPYRWTTRRRLLKLARRAQKG